MKNSKIKDRLLNLPLQFKIWIYFIVFSGIVFVLLWFFQIFFLENFYEKMKISDIVSTGQEISQEYEFSEDATNFNSFIEEKAIENDLCIEFIDKYGRSMYSVELFGECLIHGKNNVISIILPDLKSSEDDVITYVGQNKLSNTRSFIYAEKIVKDDSLVGYLFLNAPIEPVSSTVSIIKRQLSTIILILIAIAFIISLYVSNRIARPIAKITKTAERLAQGDYDVKFDGKGYAESQQLARTLTYAGKQISQVDTLQRDLIANVSHDLRTPLTMLKAYAEMIRDLSGDNPVKREQHLGIIIEETDRLASLVNDMLDLSRLESGKQTLTISTFEISSKLSEIISRFKGVSEKMGYNIQFEADESREVQCDIVKIEQVIYNLINNAINYTGKDKQVYVKQINLDYGVKVEIRDTGDGIDQEKIKLIFDKYYRSENHKREVIGTGLGLSIVKAILKMHNYDYGVNSIIGKGSTFWFIIKNKK